MKQQYLDHASKKMAKKYWNQFDVIGEFNKQFKKL